MPIYEFYCPRNHRIYQFFARTMAQGPKIPKCPDNPRFRMRKILSGFAVAGRNGEKTGPGEAAMGALEGEFAGLTGGDPRAMGRVMRRMAEVSGEPLGGRVGGGARKLEEGADPEAPGEDKERQPDEGAGDDGAGRGQGRLARRRAPARGPKLHEYP